MAKKWSWSKFWGNVGKGAATGAAGGAITGAGTGLATTGGALSLPAAGVGALLGGAGGGIAGAFENAYEDDTTSGTPGQTGSGGDDFSFQKWLFDTPEGQQAISRFSPEQRQALSDALKSGRNRINNPSQGFEPIRQNALNTFNQRIVPSLTHQFSASGSNAPSSGTLLSQLSGAGADLSSDLASLESQFGQRNTELGLKELGLGLSPQYDQGISQQGGQSNYKKIIDVLQDQFQNYLAGRNKQSQPGVSAQITNPQPQQPQQQKQYFGISPKVQPKQYFGITNPKGM
jgi:hypothetical protein